MLKYSRQRECIKNNLLSRCDHPTAEMVFSDIRKELPHISLGTVYRNLSLLAEIGEAQKIAVDGSPDRFDGIAEQHGHFHCKKCGSVTDFAVPGEERLNKRASKGFAGRIESHSVVFHGICPECLAKLKDL